MVACQGCGMSLRFDPAQQKLVCDYCGNVYYPTELTAGKNANSQVSYEDELSAGANQEDDLSGQYIEGTLFTCPQCGGEVLSDSDTAVTFCSYCGVSVELQGRTVRMKAPSYVIPFQKTKEECLNLYKDFLNKTRFAPDYMKEPGQLDKLRGIYMPYWVYEFTHKGPMSLSGSKSYRRGDYQITDHYRLTTDLDLYYKGVSFDASSSFSDTYSQAIAPYDMSQSKDYAPGYISGFYADTADVDAKVYEDNAKSAASTDAITLIRNENPVLSQYHVSTDSKEIKNSLKTKDSFLAYFPVWFLSTRHNDKVSYAVINAQTGKIAADVPIDFKKYLTGSLLLSLPIIGILHLLLKTGMELPWNAISFITFMSVVFALIALIMSNNRLNKIYTRENSLDDEGYMVANNISAPADVPKPDKPKTKKAKTKANSFAALLFYGSIIVFSVAIETELYNLITPAILVFVVGFAISVAAAPSSAKAASKPVKNKIYKMPFNEKKSVIIKPIIAVAIGLISMLDKLLEINLLYIDEVKYALMLVQIVFVVLSFREVITLHNRLTTHIPKQFNKRGGDE